MGMRIRYSWFMTATALHWVNQQQYKRWFSEIRIGESRIKVCCQYGRVHVRTEREDMFKDLESFARSCSSNCVVSSNDGGL